MKKFLALFAAAAFALSTAARADAPTHFGENFNNINQLPGWSLLNNSAPPGINWFQGNAGIFPARFGPPDSYIAANFLGASGGMGTLDMWLITPVIQFTGPTSLNFWARSAVAPGFADTLQLLIGTGTDPAGYTLFKTIDPVAGDWIEYHPALDASGDLRLAFRYTGDAAHANYLGIDSLSIEPVPEPATWIMLCLGLCAIAGYRHRRTLVVCGAVAISSVAFAGGAQPQQQQQQSDPQADGMIAVKDPQTGQLRPPTPSEAQALRQAAAALQPSAAPVTIKRPDGSLQRHLGDAGMTYSVISRTPDGKLAIDCVNGAKAAADALKHEGERHETR